MQFEIELPEGSQAFPVLTFNIFDGKGNFVISLSGQLTDGKTAVVGWDRIDGNGEYVPSGIYYYQVNASGMQYFGKMIITR